MSRGLRALGLAAASCGGLLAQFVSGDAAGGELLLHQNGCGVCHRIDGKGGGPAADLGRRMSRNYTATNLANAIWNRAPSMWSGPRHQSHPIVSLGQDQAANLFAYFCSRRYFEPLGDARRGKQVFAAKQCAGCHGIRNNVSPGAKPVAAWNSLRDPIGFARQLWNRPPAMLREFERKGLAFPRFSPLELNDLLLYLENLPEIRGRESTFRLVPAAAGRELYRTKGCTDCHHGRLALENRLPRFSMAGIGAAMWNHTPVGGPRPALGYEEMCGLVSYLWSLESLGDPGRGGKTFQRKNCDRCHGRLEVQARDSKVAVLHERNLSPVSILWALWNHGPAMQARMSRSGLAWPRLAGSDLADMAAYLRTRAASAAAEVPFGNAAGLDGLSRVHDQ